MMLSRGLRLSSSADLGWLRRKTPPKTTGNNEIRSVDLFSGCGGLTLGVREVCRRMGMGHAVELASEINPDIFRIYKKNFNPRIPLEGDILEYFDGEVSDSQLTENEGRLVDDYPGLVSPDLLVGGPPCQGHSDLNNHSRREDPRNSLYFSMIRAAKVLRPRAIIIENVQTVIHSKEEVVQTSIRILEEMGYYIADSILKAEDFGVPQLRRRHFLVASMDSEPDFSILDSYKISKPRSLRWAIRDLFSAYDEESVFNSSANSSSENRRRMRWLLKNDKFDLPNEHRPPCHQNGHNYPAVYGRMRWENPAHTITAGFGSNGQGRFMHPDHPRTLTPHEAARVQTFPDWFDFSDHKGKRSTLSKSIGNAVPPLLAMHVALVALDAINR